jgi:hypothetical protein
VRVAGEPIDIPEQFSDAERVRAKAVAATDRRLAVALNDTQFGVTQVLAGAPELISRWQHTDAYTQAVVAAAIDAQRLGIRPPLTTDLLSSAATAYLTERHRASAQRGWFPKALAHATDPGKGTTALLLPCSSPDQAVTGTVTGYQVADFLLQHGTRLAFSHLRPPVPGTLMSTLSQGQRTSITWPITRASGGCMPMLNTSASVTCKTSTRELWIL